MNLDFLERASDEIKALEAHDADLATAEENLRRERTDVRSRIGELSRAVSTYRRVMKLPSVKPDSKTFFPEAALSSATNGRSTRTIADLAEEYMADHGGHAKVAEVLTELVRLKRLAGNHNDYGTVYGTLSRNPNRFVKVAAGEFAVIGS